MKHLYWLPPPSSAQSESSMQVVKLSPRGGMAFVSSAEANEARATTRSTERRYMMIMCHVILGLERKTENSHLLLDYPHGGRSDFFPHEFLHNFELVWP